MIYRLSQTWTPLLRLFGGQESPSSLWPWLSVSSLERVDTATTSSGEIATSIESGALPLAPSLAAGPNQVESQGVLHLPEATPQIHRPSSRSPTPETPAESQVPPTIQSLLRANENVVEYFTNARNFTIEQQIITNIQRVGHSKTVFEYLEPYISHGAAHNSAERSDAPSCDAETRLAVQEDIVSWVKHGDRDEDPKEMMWLSGPAGSGKTAIAGSVAETCKEMGLLAASFFFSCVSGAEDRQSKRCVVATLAQHLAEHDCLSEYRDQLLATIQRHPNIFQKRLGEQADCLLLRPFRAMQGQVDRSNWPTGIIIDGLDEVVAQQSHGREAQGLELSNEDDQLEILTVLATLAKDPAFPFRIFIASRPDRVINEFFSTTAQEMTIKLFLDSEYESDADVEKFLLSKFAGIRRRYGIANNAWPGQRVVDRIVGMSSGQFIVPATIVRHVEAGVPQRQLHEVMQLSVGKEVAGNRPPLAVADALYMDILRRSFDPLLAMKWIRLIVRCENSVLQRHPPQFWKLFLEDTEGEWMQVLRRLSSIISIPSACDQTSDRIIIYHKSFIDFVSSRSRCLDLYVDDDALNSFLADRCVHILKHKGPGIAPSSTTELIAFLNPFLDWVDVLCSGFDPRNHRLMCKKYAGFMQHLSEQAISDLTFCDVRWWAHLMITRKPDPSSSESVKSRFTQHILGSMYCRVHTDICQSKHPYAHCHVACRNWRAGILAEFKALNWCVGGLEQIDVRQLSRVDLGDWMGLVHRNKGRVGCSHCQPSTVES